MVKVKICGITNPEDALQAVAAGADALGFIFASSSPRAVGPAKAREIISRLPPFITSVGVFVDQALEHIKKIRSFCGLEAIQLHGRESPEFCAVLGGKVIKAARVKDRSSLEGLGSYRVAAFLLDTYQAGKAGGTGRTFDWRLAEEAGRHGHLILSGGLTPDNVQAAVRQVRPYGVDTASGVEISPGRKDVTKLRAFIALAKAL